jgi:hypothetical protein
MLTKTLAAVAAFSMLVAGGEALAAQKKLSPTVAGPKEPIPYSQLDTYLKASPKARASKDWWAGSASTGQATTGMPSDTSATAPAAPPMADTAVNPMPSAAPPSMPMTPPTDAAPLPGAPGASPVTPPAEPK